MKLYYKCQFWVDICRQWDTVHLNRVTNSSLHWETVLMTLSGDLDGCGKVEFSHPEQLSKECPLNSITTQAKGDKYLNMLLLSFQKKKKVSFLHLLRFGSEDCRFRVEDAELDVFWGSPVKRSMWGPKHAEVVRLCKGAQSTMKPVHWQSANELYRKLKETAQVWITVC